AEDGIRDRNVTGVQTCALPICQSLLVELRKASDHLHLNFDAFDGTLASGSSRSNDGKEASMGHSLDVYVLDSDGDPIEGCKVKKIGRASCRERVRREVGEVAYK